MASAGAYSDARMEGHINSKTVAPDVEISKKAADGKTVKTANPAYEEWFAGDKHILGFLFASVSKEVFVQIATSQTAAQAWRWEAGSPPRATHDP